MSDVLLRTVEMEYRVLGIYQPRGMSRDMLTRGAGAWSECFISRDFLKQIGDISLCLLYGCRTLS